MVIGSKKSIYGNRIMLILFLSFIFVFSLYFLVVIDQLKINQALCGALSLTVLGFIVFSLSNITPYLLPFKTLPFNENFKRNRLEIVEEPDGFYVTYYFNGCPQIVVKKYSSFQECYDNYQELNLTGTLYKNWFLSVLVQ